MGPPEKTLMKRPSLSARETRMLKDEVPREFLRCVMTF